jgi:hypothetical protein
MTETPDKPPETEARHYLSAIVRQELLQYLELQKEALDRITELLSAAEWIRNRGPSKVLSGPSLDDQEILRAAVVLTHAYLEDFVRTIARNLLPHADTKSLDKVPVKLGTFVRLGHDVDKIVSESVSAYLDRKPFSGKEDIKNLFKMVSVKLSPLQETYLNELDEMSQRRHRIVHAGDREVSPGSQTIFRPITHAEGFKVADDHARLYDGRRIRVAGGSS